MATYLDTHVEAFRDRPLDAGPHTFVWTDALTVNVHALIPVDGSGGGREVVGLDIASQEDGADWLRFLRSLAFARLPARDWWQI